VNETPEDEQRNDELGEATPADEAAGGAPEGQSDEQSTRAASAADATSEPASEEPSAEEPVAEEPVAEEPVAEEPVAEDPIVEQPSAEAVPEEPAAEPVAEEPVGEEPVAEAPAAEEPVAEQPAAAAAPGPAAAKEDADVAPRAKPEIPGADLEPDLMPDSDQYLDAEAQAAAEAEAEAAAERARLEAEDERSRPIADATIDLAAGARYTATGKRKTAVARVILKPGAGTYSINGKELNDFFPRETLQRMIRQPLETVGYESRMDVVALMHGGGVSSQAGALRHGISRALISADPNLRGELKRRGYLTRDPRVKERKKAGLKKARKRPQFSKR
jgi:small subunit ribosomal protein S9